MNNGTQLVEKLKQILPPVVLIAGALELVDDGSLWKHIGNSLWRIGCGFALAVLVAVPMGLWMGRVDGVFRTFNDSGRARNVIPITDRAPARRAILS